jgi:hypothetical protein
MNVGRSLSSKQVTRRHALVAAVLVASSLLAPAIGCDAAGGAGPELGAPLGADGGAPTPGSAGDSRDAGRGRPAGETDDGAPPSDPDAAAAPDDAGGGGGVIGPVGDAGPRTAPTCATSTPSPNDSRASECDYLLQSLDFEDSFGYSSPAGSLKLTSYGDAFGPSSINTCSPYCYGKNLTVGVDIVGGGSAAQLRGELILELPSSGPGLPITAADATRNGLAWITFDGPAKPGFEIDTQLVLETSAGIVPAVEAKAFFKTGGNLAPFGPFNVTNNYSYSNGCEFKYFPMTSASGFPSAPANVTGIGFRITAKAVAGQEWHGVVYIDHAQIRGAGADNPTDAGAYPYGL